MENRLYKIAELGRPGHATITRREAAACEFPPVEEVFPDAEYGWESPQDWVDVFVYDVDVDWSIAGRELPTIAFGARNWFEGNETYADGDPAYTIVAVYEGIQPDCGDVADAPITGALSGRLLSDAELSDFGHEWDHQRVRSVLEEQIAEMERNNPGGFSPAVADERVFLDNAE